MKHTLNFRWLFGTLLTFRLYGLRSGRVIGIMMISTWQFHALKKPLLWYAIPWLIMWRDRFFQRGSFRTVIMSLLWSNFHAALDCSYGRKVIWRRDVKCCFECWIWQRKRSREARKRGNAGVSSDFCADRMSSSRFVSDNLGNAYLVYFNVKAQDGLILESLEAFKKAVCSRKLVLTANPYQKMNAASSAMYSGIGWRS